MSWPSCAAAAAPSSTPVSPMCPAISAPSPSPESASFRSLVALLCPPATHAASQAPREELGGNVVPFFRRLLHQQTTPWNASASAFPSA
jgi:hypothetical protein